MVGRKTSRSGGDDRSITFGGKASSNILTLRGAHASIASTSRMLVPPDRVKLLSASELATYGINALDAVALEERRAHAQFLPR
jgi:hypothetical protein